MSISYYFAANNSERDFALMSTANLSGYAVGLIAGLVAALVWAAGCVWLGFSLAGVAGIALGLVTGGAVLAVLRDGADAAAALLAAALTFFVLLAGVAIQARGERAEVADDVASDDSYITAIAEDMLWQQSAATPEENAANGASTVSPEVYDLPPGVSDEAIPAAVMQEATARWQAMPEAEREKIRSVRQRWLSASQGESLEHLERGPSWTATISVVVLSSALALLVASSPAIAARYVFRGES